jgi:pilus assembly protein CpaB
MGRRAVVLVIALLLAAGSAFAIFQWLRNKESELLAQRELVPVYRVTEQVQEGTSGDDLLTSRDLLLDEDSDDEVEDVPADVIAEGDIEYIRGKVAVGPISANGILTYNQWVSPTIALTPLTDLISPGAHAITISPGDVQGVNGFPEPGDLVNVIVTVDIEVDLTAAAQTPDFGIPTDTGTEGDGTEEQSIVVPYTRLVLQNLKVLAAGTEVVAAPNDAPTVTAEGAVGDATATGTVQGEETAPQITTIYTLEVEPTQAERLVYAIENGSIYLTLGRDDNAEVATVGVTIDNLFEGELLQDIFGN